MTKLSNIFDTNGPRVDVITSSTYTVQQTDDGRTKRLDVSGNFTLTVPDNLTDNIQVAFLGVVTGTVTITEGGTAEVFPANQAIVSGSTSITAFSLIHDGAGAWLLLTGLLSEPKARIITVAASGTVTLQQADDGAIVQLGTNAGVDFGSGIVSGWGVDLVYTSTTGSTTITRGAGQVLYGPAGNQAEYLFGDGLQWAGASAYSRGGGEFVLIGPVTTII